jgi:hypothetical protein
MAFTYTGFVNNLSGMAISGVTRRLAAPPAQIGTADLPLSYVRSPGGDTPVITLTGVAGMRNATVELCVVMEPSGQSSNSANFSAALTMIDAIDTALRINASAFGIDQWRIQQEMVSEGSNFYWQIIARVEGSGTV